MTNGGHKRSRTATVSKVVLPSGATRFEVVPWASTPGRRHPQAGAAQVRDREGREGVAWPGVGRREPGDTPAGRTQPYRARAGVEDFVAAKALTLRASTARNYQMQLNHLVQHCGDKPLASLSRGDITSMMAGMQREGMAASSINACRAVVLNLLGKAQRDALSRENVGAWSSRGVPQTENVALDQAQMRSAARRGRRAPLGTRLRLVCQGNATRRGVRVALVRRRSRCSRDHRLPQELDRRGQPEDRRAGIA